MITFLSILAIGFFLGMRHATDPDHVIAVTTIVSSQGTGLRAALIGAFWGIGHTVTILFVGALIILFNLVIPVKLGLGMELSVAVMLIILGFANVVAFLRSQPFTTKAADLSRHGSAEQISHNHMHSHGYVVHSHLHSHEVAVDENSAKLPPHVELYGLFGRIGAHRYLRPLAVGIVHGLAGSAAVALLVLTTIRDPRWAIAYLLVFGLGTIGGMMIITLGIASSFRFLTGGRKNLTRNLAMASGVLSVAFGLFISYQICIVDGIFGANPQWIPK